MITDEQAIEYARKLKEYCDNRGELCATCPFATESIFGNPLCDCIGVSLDNLKKPLGDAIG